MTWIYNSREGLDEESSWRHITVVAVVLTSIMSLVVFARLLSRRTMLGLEDLFVFISATFSIVYNALTIMQTRYGLGLPMKLRPVVDIYPYVVYNYAGRPFYIIGIGCFKLALCIGYLRFTARTTDRKFRRVIMLVIAWISVTTFVNLCLNLFGCRPLSKMFHHDIPGTCIPFAPVNYFISADIIFSDIITFTLPIRIISPLSLPWKKKLQVCALFALGFSTTVFSILRAASIYKNASGVGNLTDLVTYGCIELNVGIITSCLPFVRRPSEGKSRSGSKRTYELEATGGSQAVKSSNLDKDEIRLRVDGTTTNAGSEESSITGLCGEHGHPWDDEETGIVKTMEFDVQRINAGL